MQPLFTADTFQAFTTDNGVLIQSKSKGARKMGIIVTVMGLVFLAISFIDTSKLFYDSSTFSETVSSIFYYVFRWGGFVLLGAGIITLLAKGFAPAGNSNVVIDSHKREVNLRGRVIPFDQVEGISAQTSQVMGRSMTILILSHNRKKTALVPGAIVSKDPAALEAFVKELDGMVKGL